MSYIDHSNVIDGNTGETLSKDAASDNPHAVLSKCWWSRGCGWARRLRSSAAMSTLQAGC